MSMNVWNAYLFGRLNAKTVADCVKWLGEAKKAYYEYLVDNMGKYLQNFVDEGKSLHDFAQRVRDDILSPERSKFFSVDLDVSVIMYQKKIVLLFWPQSMFANEFLKERTAGLQEWWYTNQTDDGWDDPNYRQREKFWESFGDDFRKFSDGSFIYELFEKTETFRFAVDAATRHKLIGKLFENSLKQDKDKKAEQ